MSTLLVAGLGNPGREYENTRHNYGFALVDALAHREKLSWKYHDKFSAEITRWESPPTRLLVKPQTYMNDSGRALQALANFYKIPVASIVVIYDDLTIELGRAKVSIGGSAGGHNGIASLLEHLGDGFIRYRLGIGPKEPKEMDLKDFVLGNFTTEQQPIAQQSLPHHLEGLSLLLEKGPAHAMNQINRKNQT